MLNTGKNKNMIRQGDVLLIKRDKPAKKEKAIAADRGRTILAYGEVTGHAHAIDAKDATLHQVGQDRVLEVHREAILKHEEHDHLTLEKGEYDQAIQMEFEREFRVVAD